MLLLLPYAPFNSSDEQLVLDILRSTDALLGLEESLIDPLQGSLRRRWSRSTGAEIDRLVEQTEFALHIAVKTALMEAARFEALGVSEKGTVTVALERAGLTGPGLQAKAAAYQLLWQQLATMLNDLEAGRPFRGWDRVERLLELLKGLWNSLKSAIPGVEQVEEILGLLAQLIALARGLVLGRA
ncbi:MAG: hypothetical protein ACK46C_03950 [Flavobacteriales bacterium]